VKDLVNVVVSRRTCQRCPARAIGRSLLLDRAVRARAIAAVGTDAAQQWTRCSCYRSNHYPAQSTKTMNHVASHSDSEHCCCSRRTSHAASNGTTPGAPGRSSRGFCNLWWSCVCPCVRVSGCSGAHVCVCPYPLCFCRYVRRKAPEHELDPKRAGCKRVLLATDTSDTQICGVLRKFNELEKTLTQRGCV
jgi:hypothetical protein